LLDGLAGCSSAWLVGDGVVTVVVLGDAVTVVVGAVTVV
jgi:hypothetical protein